MAAGLVRAQLMMGAGQALMHSLLGSQSVRFSVFRLAGRQLGKKTERSDAEYYKSVSVKAGRKEEGSEGGGWCYGNTSVSQSVSRCLSRKAGRQTNRYASRWQKGR